MHYESIRLQKGPDLIQSGGIMGVITMTGSLPRSYFASDGIVDRCQVSAKK